MHESVMGFKAPLGKARRIVGRRLRLRRISLGLKWAVGRKFPRHAAFCCLLTVFLFGFAAGDARSQAGQGQLPVFKDDLDRDSLHRAIHRSLEYLQRVPPERPVGEWPRRITGDEIKKTLLLFMERLELLGKPDALLSFTRARFDLFRSDGERGDGNVLFTGYYQPVISASLVETEEFRFPIYGRPKDLVELEVPGMLVENCCSQRGGRVTLSNASASCVARRPRRDGTLRTRPWWTPSGRKCGR